MRVKVGDSFSKELHFDEAGIASFAAMAGDTNPLHRDAAYAASTRFKTIIAAGAHVSAVLISLVADRFAGIGPNAGLEFSFRFLAPVRAGDTVTLRWRVVAVTRSPSLRGDIVSLTGEAVRADGIVATVATGSAVMFDEP